MIPLPVKLSYNHNPISIAVDLPGSKSISNRLLVLSEVLELDMKLENISDSNDTSDLIKAIRQIKTKKVNVIDAGEGGTDTRFLAALLSITSGEWILTASDRMKQRPIRELTEALKHLGAEISYPEKEGFIPLKIKGGELKGGSVTINGNISSQFISALLLIAPALKNGLQLHIKGTTVSWPYIQMTIDILKEFGVEVKLHGSQIDVLPFRKTMEKYVFAVESDWSAASYWYSLLALAPAAHFTLKGLNRISSQGDSVLREIYGQLGVNTEFGNGDVVLTKIPVQTSFFEYDFSSCPDLAQTVAVTCLGLNIPCCLTGLSTLKHKETDRIAALKTELEKFGAMVIATGESL
jgi:3-phosphoshikimate 1-carboxyvinyltransferase